MHWFTNLKTRSKLTAGFGLVMALLLLIVITAWFSLRAVRDAERSIADVMALRNNFNGQSSAMLGALASPQGPEIESRLQDAADYSASNNVILQRLANQYDRDAEFQPLIEQISAIRTDFIRVRNTEVIPFIREQKKEEAAALILGAQSARSEKFRGLARDLTQRLTDRSEARMRQAHLVFILLAAGALLAAVVMIVSLGRMIASPLETITAAAEKIAEGDISVELADTARKDEVGALWQAFQRMCGSLAVFAGRARQIAEGDLTAQIQPRSEQDVLGNAFASMVTELRRLMRELLEAANVLASSASEIMASTTQLAMSAAETAAAVSETTVTVEEMKHTSEVSSEKAKYVAAESQRAAAVARDGEFAADQTTAGMTGIRQQMGAVTESILNLSSLGLAIGKIVATVDDLAAQSKLLAVNASIEAAKAGNEGKGFGVVSQEVRSLAEQSKQATKQVRGILTAIQKATDGAVQATELGDNAVEAGMRQSTSSGQAIRALAESIAGAAQASTQIAATSQQQFAGMNQVAMAMENIKSASAQTVASTRQAEKAAQQLHLLGQQLKALVERFKT